MLPTSHLKEHGRVSEFGDKFRKAREQKELSLDDVSNVTKISARMLQAIEQEHFDQLPGGVFNKGFIRAYAKHLGLNSEDAVNDYLACLRQAQIDSHAGWDSEKRTDHRAPVVAKAGTAPPKTSAKVQGPVVVEELPELQLPRAEDIRPARKEYLNGPTSRTPWGLMAAVALVLIAVILFWSRHSRNSEAAEARSSSVSVAPASSSPPSAAVPQTPTPVTTAMAVPKTATPVQQQPQATQPTPVANAPTPAATAQRNPDATPARTATPANSATAPAKVEEKSDVTIRSFEMSVAKPSDKSPTSLSLVIRASENSWVSVSSDGQLVTQETLIAPAHTTVHARNEIVARIGNAAGVTFLWNGQEIAAQGAEGEVKTLVFDSQGMHVAPPNQAVGQN